MSTPAGTGPARTRLVDPWRISLWAVQLLLAASFGEDGFLKATQPIGALAETFNWPGQVPEGLVRLIGGSELAAALGLVLPAATRILPYLTPLAAVFLTLLMWAAFVFHAMRGDWQMLLADVALGLLAALVAWGRFTSAPLGSRFETRTGQNIHRHEAHFGLLEDLLGRTRSPLRGRRRGGLQRRAVGGRRTQPHKLLATAQEYLFRTSESWDSPQSAGSVARTYAASRLQSSGNWVGLLDRRVSYSVLDTAHIGVVLNCENFAPVPERTWHENRTRYAAPCGAPLAARRIGMWRRLNRMAPSLPAEC